jgi:hypothetical protein
MIRKTTAQDVVLALAAWYEESQGTDGPDGGAYFVDTDLTWKETVDLLAKEQVQP